MTAELTPEEWSARWRAAKAHARENRMTDEEKEIYETYQLDILPHHMQGSMLRWIAQGIEPGDFGLAVLENNLVDAFGRADYINEANMKVWAKWIYQYAPRGCWGSREEVEKWAKHRGLANLNGREE